MAFSSGRTSPFERQAERVPLSRAATFNPMNLAALSEWRAVRERLSRELPAALRPRATGAPASPVLACVPCWRASRGGRRCHEPLRFSPACRSPVRSVDLEPRLRRRAPPRPQYGRHERGGASRSDSPLIVATRLLGRVERSGVSRHPVSRWQGDQRACAANPAGAREAWRAVQRQSPMRGNGHLPVARSSA
jgi:hypothetical protein